MAYDNKNFGNNDNRNNESLFSKRIKAGKRRTYFFDVRSTRGNDYFITITESKKRFDDNGYDRHKMFLYKEDFNKFIKALGEAVDYVKTELMPDFNFDAFNHDEVIGEHDEAGVEVEVEVKEEAPAVVAQSVAPIEIAEPAKVADTSASEEVDKW